MKLSSFFKQCHEKEVFKMLSIYVVSAWIILQVLAVTWQPLGLPEKSVTFLIIILLLCFPIYIFLLWKFRLAKIHQAEIAQSEKKPKKELAFRKTYFSALGIIASLCVIAVFLIVNKNFLPANNSLPKIISSDKIAVLKFGNNTGDHKYDIVSKMASDWIIHGITENQVAQVITQDLVDEYRTILKGKKIEEDESTIVREYLKPSKIISGNFYLKNEKLLFQGMLIDGKTNKTIISFKPTQCLATNPLECIEDLNESITGYFITKDKQKLMLQETPPKYEAYKLLLEAKNSNENETYINLLNRAIASDSTYFEPKVLRVAHYYNQQDFKTADSLLNLIKPDSYTNKRQLNLLNMYEALLKGDNRTVYKTLLNEYKIAPFDLTTNKTAMVVALQFVNKPEDVEAIYKVIPMDSINLQNCSDCVARIYVNAYANIELGNYTAALQTIEDAQNKFDAKILNKPLAIAYVRANKIEELDQFLRKIEITNSPAEVNDLYLQVGKEFLLKNNKTKAMEYFKYILNSDSAIVAPVMLAEALFYAEAYEKAEKILNTHYANNPTDVEALTKLAICNFKMGNQIKAETYLENLETLPLKYQFGSINYALAQYYAATENQPQFQNHLLKAVANGHKYHWKFFKNDPQFLKYSNTAVFEEAMNFWK
ncbi:tetratricopeptide repeat protein [Aequorivita flava]|uniref:Tetratricopeptide repeat protein n=1 Tax=Aequorivita flava TaxID=3114371 RepID=A0AB35YRV9_9FLAO